MTLEYRQLQPPEGINTSDEHPLKEFVQLLAGISLLVVAIVILFSLAVRFLAPLVPFSVEQRLATAIVDSMEEGDDTDKAMEAYLQSLAGRLTAVQALPEGVSITVHYIDSDTVNAFATLGGHLFFFRGLLERIPDENTLAMVMAHEIAHITYRHPIKALGQGVIVGAAITMVSYSVGSDIVGSVLGEAGLLTTLTFSREQESQADEEALAALARLYGHVDGSVALFEILKRSQSDIQEVPQFYSSHPHTENRIEKISAMAMHNHWSTTGPLSPLPPLFKQWLEEGEAGDCARDQGAPEVAKRMPSCAVE